MLPVKIKYIKILIFNLLIINILNAQISTFDTSTDGWKVEGDAQNLTAIPVFKPTGGNPAGYAYSKDDATGGVWFWVAPKKYLGNKCNAYGKNFTFDLFTTDDSKPFNNSDIIIASPGAILYYDTQYNPGLTWTNFSVQLDETDNWHYNSLSGPLATKAQIQQVLMNVTAIKIRGEFQIGPDAGGLDNVRMEGDISFLLDADQSSKAKYGDYNADTICGNNLVSRPLCDKDLLFSYVGAPPSQLKFGFDSTALGNIADIKFTATTNIKPVQANANSPFVANISNLTDSTECKNFIKSLRVEFDSKTMVEKFVINVTIVLNSNCSITRQVTFVNIKKLYKGIQKDTVLCENAKRVYLSNFLDSNAKGVWSPQTQKKDFFDPAVDQPNLFRYNIKAIDNCLTDSLFLKINVIKTLKYFLGEDLTICKDSAYILDISRFNYDKYIWQDATNTSQYNVTQAGKYIVKMQKNACFASDTINISNFSCSKCKFYAPNTFSPNSDGINDLFEIFSECEQFQSYLFVVYDRWGNHVFETDKSGDGWDGAYRGKPLSEGVYTYYLKAVTDYKNKPFETLKKGDFLLLR